MQTSTKFNLWKEKLFGDRVDIRTRFQALTLLCVFGLALTDGMLTVLIRRSLPMFWMRLAAAALVAALFAAALFLFRRVRGTLLTLCLLMTILIDPVLFFISGGMGGSGELWIILSLFCSYIMLSGPALYILVATTCIVDTAVYIFFQQNPGLLSPPSTVAAILIDSCYTVITLSIAMGMLFKLGMKMYDREQELANERAKEIERISQARSTFFANMSHEIRTPINTIIGLNEMILREQHLSEEVAENASNIYNASKLLLTVINDILDVSKIESGKMEIVPAQYETASMFSELVNFFWIRIYDKKLEFKLDIDEKIPSMLYGDEIRLKQVISNLLTNAVKYTEKGSVTLSVKGEQIDANTIRLRISIEDTGMGIKKETLKNLFSAFQRVNQDKTRAIEGTGLGLLLSKQLIELMGGKIVVDSVYQVGSVFSIIVDQQIVDASPIGSIDLATKKRRDRSRYQQRFEAPDAKILIVDDNEMNLLVATKLLRETKVQIDTASSGNECLQKTLAKSYHVIFMDHIMPGMDGEETLSRLRRQDNGHCKEVPVIALTANAMSGADQIYRDKGFEGYLAKPINGALLEATLMKYLPKNVVEYSAVEEEAENVDDAVQIFSGRFKRKIRITTDCICDLSEDLLERFGIKMMYTYVQTKQGHFCDVQEISSDSLMRYLKKDGNAAVSEPATVEEYETFFAGALQDAETVIHISASSGVSESYNRAAQAADSFDNVMVLDSKHLSGGLGILALHAARMVQSGQSAEEIYGDLADLRNTVFSSCVLNRPEALYQNHRIPLQLKTLFQALQLHPILRMSKGTIRLWRLVAGKRELAYKKYIRLLLMHKNKIDKRILIIAHVGCTTEELKKVQEELLKRIPFEEIYVQKTSATVAANFGVGTFGLMFMLK